MSPAPAFKTVVFFDQDEILIFTQEKKTWERKKGKFSLDTLPDKEVRDLINDGNVLAVVADSLCGHLQVELPNKKDQYSDENIGQVLQREHHIDLDAYEFASQRFPLGRENVQVSISGIEKAVFHQVEEWVTALGAKKFWVVPFGWFIASLKAVEPALIAVVSSEDKVFVSHHYLGVDDARTIELKDLKDYSKARRDERKETHLLYVQAEPELRRKATTIVGDEVAVHPLLPEETEDPMAAVVEAVMAKGSETLAELLHFVGEERAPKEQMTEEKKSKKTKSKTAEVAALEAEIEESVEIDDLPKPTPPEIQPPDAPLENTADGEEMARGRTVVEIEEPGMESVVIADLDPEESAPSLIIAAELEPVSEPALVSQLQGGGVMRDNTDRYLEMPNQPRWKGPFLVFLAVAVITGVVGGAVLWSRQVWSPGQSLLPQGELVSPTPSPTPVPDTTPVPEASSSADLSTAEKRSTKIVILNATGIPGLAGKVKTKLAEAGWQSVQTGNAEGTYDGATFVFTEKTDLIPALSADLGLELKRAPQVKESQAANYAVVIILAERISLE